MVEWTKAIFGEKIAFYTSWFYLIANIFYYPTLLTFSGISLAYVINPDLASSKLFISSYVIVLFWVGTVINIKGVEFLAIFAKYGGFLGNILPIIAIIILALISVFLIHRPVPTSYAFSNWFHDFTSSNLLFLATLTFAMSGGELTSAFASDMPNPKKDFAKATLISALLISVCYILGTIALTLVLNPHDIGAASGPLQLIYKVTSILGAEWITKVICILIAVSTSIGAALWMVGTIKMFTEGNDKKFIPKTLRKENKNGIPSNALIIQSVVVTVIVLLTSLMKTVENLYTVLVMMATITLFIVYLVVLLAYFKLKFKMQKDNKFTGIYEVPGKKAGAFTAFFLATIATVVTIIIPIFSPGNNNVIIYELEIIGGPILFWIIAWLLIRKAERAVAD